MATITLGPTASAHDAYEASGGAVDISSNAIQIADGQWGGLYALSAIPAESDINSAILRYVVTTTVYDTMNVDWYGQDADTAAVFTTTASSISGRTRTTATVNDAGTDIGGGEPRTVDVTTIVQEIVDRAGFTGPIVLIGQGLTGSTLRFRSYDNTVNIWSLDIDYTIPAGAGSGAIIANYYRMMQGA